MIVSCTLLACGGSQQTLDPISTRNSDSGDAFSEVKKPPPPKPSASKLFKQGVKKYSQRQYEQAIKKFQAAVDEDPQFGAAYFNAGRVFEELGRLDEAAKYYRQASEKGKNFSEGYANFGRIKLLMNQPEEARIAFDKARERDQFSPEVHLNEAADALSRKDYKGARKSIRASLKGNDRNPKAYGILARVYFEEGRYELAKLVCNTGLEIAKDYADLYNTRGLIFLKEQDLRTALQNFKLALKYNPQFMAAHMNIGAITFNYRDYDASLSHFDAVLAKEPKNIVALLSRAVSLRGLGRLADAEAGYRDVLKLNPQYAPAHFNLGVLKQEHMDKLEDAIAHYQKALEFERADTKLRSDAASRIKAVREQIQDRRDMEEADRQEREEEARMKAEEAAREAEAKKAKQNAPDAAPKTPDSKGK